ncbi:putative lysozyme from lambdoid prophage DLP12, partial [Escherichia coli 90.0091]
WR